jgi:hypothetical protein
VAIVAEQQDTRNALQQYLRASGIGSIALRALSGALMPAITALVLFPDEFPATHVVTRVSALRRNRPSLFIIIVTSAPQRIASALRTERGSPIPLVLQKPVFGWSIVDSIRAHWQREASDG